MLKGRRKARRPLDSKRPIHLVLKARQDFLLLRNRKLVELVARRFARRFGLKVYGLAVQADHLHLILKIPTRQLYVRWIRAVSAEVSRRMPGLTWKHRPYSRIAGWGRQLEVLRGYIARNVGEAKVILNAHRRLREFELKSAVHNRCDDTHTSARIATLQSSVADFICSQ